MLTMLQSFSYQLLFRLHGFSYVYFYFSILKIHYLVFFIIIYLAVYSIRNISLKIVLIIIYIGILLSVALSRIMLDAHYATDVIGAVIISIAWFFLCLYFFYKPKDTSFSMYR